jgi:hypothetical protein
MPYELSIFESDDYEPRRIERNTSPVVVLRCQTPFELGREIAQTFRSLTAKSFTVGPVYAERGTKRILTADEEWAVLKAGCTDS